ncbi:MAG: hypothetical protein ACQGVC_11240, partial [Myxococcota bacterium]
MKAPLSERAVRAACLGFALWTLCAHAVVLAGGSLTGLMGLFAAVGAAVLYVRRRLARMPDARGAEGAGAQPAGPEPAPEPAWLQPAALAVAL